MKVKGSPEWLENWEHLVITGKSKAGKTTLGNEIYTETDRIAIAIDQLKLGRFKGSTTSSVHGVKSLLKQGKTRVVLNQVMITLKQINKFTQSLTLFTHFQREIKN